MYPRARSSRSADAVPTHRRAPWDRTVSSFDGHPWSIARSAPRPNWYPCHATTLDLDAHVSRAAPDNNGSATSARAGHLLDAHVECLFFSVGAESASTPGEPSRLFGQRQRTPQSTSRLFSRRGPRRANSPLFVYLSRHDHCVHWARRRPRRPGRVHSPFARRGESARMPPALRQRQRIPQATNGLFPKRRQWRASPTSFLGLDHKFDPRPAYSLGFPNSPESQLRRTPGSSPIALISRLRLTARMPLGPPNSSWVPIALYY
ncbi:hypothetical protein B0H14DRAFT_3855707 [Mycena olivaceomarginata]|nr:hypothetical protein B0H14DRAFT_3855707 [Mycena olivaceomarginata]